MEDEYPCHDCCREDWCDSWERQFCCRLCEYYGGGDCYCCVSMDI